MPISRSDYLIELIQVLDKSEKRTLKLQSSRQSNLSGKLYIQLFDLLDRYPNKHEDYYRDKLNIKSLQYANLKRNLYTQILKSLRVSSSNRDLKFQLKELSDQAYILFEKGLHKQSSTLIEKIKYTAEVNHVTSVLTDVVELQKKIESKFITRSRGVKNKMESLIEQSEVLNKNLNLHGTLSNLCLRIQGLYIKTGYARDSRDTELYKAYFYSNLPDIKRLSLNLPERILWHHCHVWYHHANLNFHFAYKHSVSWVECYHQDKSLIANDKSNYLRALHYALIYSFYLNRIDKYNYWYGILVDYRKLNLNKFSRVNNMIDFTYFHNAKINHLIINNKFSQLSKLVEDIKTGESYYGSQLDQHRYYIFYYKIASVYSYIGNYDKAIDYCNLIIANSSAHLKKDIGPYSRLLHIMCHYRMNNFQLVENMVDSIRSEFNMHNQNNIATELLLNFLKRGSRAMNFGLDNDITKLHSRLKSLSEEQYNKQPFIYYDYINWCLSLLHNTSVEKVKKQYNK